MVYVDQSRPRLVEGFTRRTFTVMVEGVVERALAEGLVDEAACATGDPRPRSRTRRSATRFFKSVAWKA